MSLETFVVDSLLRDEEDFEFLASPDDTESDSSDEESDDKFLRFGLDLGLFFFFDALAYSELVEEFELAEWEPETLLFFLPLRRDDLCFLRATDPDEEFELKEFELARENLLFGGVGALFFTADWRFLPKSVLSSE